VRTYFEEIAQRIGLACDTAGVGAPALDMIACSGPSDLCFIDWKMPGMDGFELTRRVKEGKADKPVIIMISAMEWHVLEDEARRSGVDKFLPKPLFPSAIIDCLNECLGLDSPKAEKEADLAQTDQFAGYRILLVEDVEINREIVLSLLEPTALSFDCAENGKEALRKFCAAPDRYDMIFMDVQMPEMDGYEATRRIRSLAAPQAAQIPIIAMTANAFREDVEDCLRAGMNDHIGKPLDFKEIIDKLRAYLPQRKA
jgi:CheY-like chemotaxis protein